MKLGGRKRGGGDVVFGAAVAYANGLWLLKISQVDAFHIQTPNAFLPSFFYFCLFYFVGLNEVCPTSILFTCSIY